MQQGELSSVIYTNLPVGSYTFHLAVLDSKDQSVQVESTYQIIKKAEIYDNWWFMLYMVAVFAIAVTYLTWLVFPYTGTENAEHTEAGIRTGEKTVRDGK